MNYKEIMVERRNRIGLITLNRPDVLNALSDAVMDELTHALDGFEDNSEISVVVITGSERAFAAGADVSMMASLSYIEAYQSNFITRNWERLTIFRKPTIAAVAGFALGGGLELAMMCDVIIAADNAKFGQSEVKLGVIPGAGGTQRLPRAIGKAAAMELCLTGRMIDADEALQRGLISRVVALEVLMEEAFATAEIIAGYSLPVLMLIKTSINNAYESSLNEGLNFERHLFHSTFALEDQKEGMAAFLEKRSPKFQHK